MFRLQYWYRRKVTTVDVRDVPHARALLRRVRATGAIVITMDQSPLNYGKWFHYLTLK